MNHQWFDASKVQNVKGADIWEVDFSAHPLLDPEFLQKDSRQLQLTREAHGRVLQNTEAFRQALVRMFYPLGFGLGKDTSFDTLNARVADYLHEADTYLASTLGLLPAASQPAVLPMPQVSDCNDLRELMTLVFQGESLRVRYEAQRKLCLAQLLIQIDQDRTIRDGQRHMTLFERVMKEGLLRYTTQEHDLVIGYHLDADGSQIRYTSRPEQGDQRWHFRSHFLQKEHGGRSISVDVLYYNCRFKRSVVPVSFEVVDGSHRVLEEVRWGDMRQQSSGSILSKMIRKGINNPSEIGDIIGAMFIVNDNDALNDLLVLLDSCLGTPLNWRNVTDTLADHPGGSSLNDFSSKEFKVFKGDVDILAQEPDLASSPYRFPVEIQIFTLEGYLRTVCGSHEANHLALKLRQFLFGLAPKIFPRAVYGTEWLDLS